MQKNTKNILVGFAVALIGVGTILFGISLKTKKSISDVIQEQAQKLSNGTKELFYQEPASYKAYTTDKNGTVKETVIASTKDGVDFINNAIANNEIIHRKSTTLASPSKYDQTIEIDGITRLLPAGTGIAELADGSIKAIKVNNITGWADGIRAKAQAERDYSNAPTLANSPTIQGIKNILGLK